MAFGVHVVLPSLSGCSHHLKIDPQLITLDTKMDTMKAL